MNKKVVSVLIAVVFLIGCKNSAPLQKEESKKSISDSTLADLKDEYNAIYEDKIWDYRYTKQFMDSIIIVNQNIILEPFHGIEDFYQREDSYIIRVTLSFPYIYCELSCDKDSFENLYKEFIEDEFRSVFLVIDLSQIEKITLAVTPKDGGDFTHIELDHSTAFIAKGKLISYKTIEENEDEI